MNAPIVDTRVAELLAPIPGDCPAGENANYDVRHEALRQEIAKLESPSAGPPDWDAVVAGGEALLRTTSKDLLIACYLAWAYFEREGLAGLARGIALAHGLLDRYWDEGFPPLRRIRGRANAIAWLVGRFEARVDTLAVDEGDRPAIAELARTVPSFAARVRARFEDAAPGLRALSSGIERLAMSLPTTTETSPSPAPAPARVAEPSPAPAAEASAAPAPTAETSSPSTNEPAALEALAGSWLAPIPGPSPAGGDARYEPEHEAVRAEIAKLESVTGGEPDWAVVERDATLVLQGKSKDLLIAAYLAGAAVELRGLAGLVEGLALVVGLCRRFWPDMQPPASKPRRRANALSWLFSRIERVLGELQPAAGDAERIAQIERAVAVTHAVVTERFDEPPATRALRELVTRLKLSIPAPAPAPAPKPAAPPAPAPAPATPPADATTPSPAATPAPTPAPSPAALGAAIPAPSALAAPADAGEVVDYLRKTGAELVTTANLLRRAKLDDPLAYRLMRTGLYLAITAAPPAGAAGKTSLPPPPGDLLARLEQMATHGKWPELLDESEGALARCRFCVELHRRSTTALAELGHAEARDAVVDGVRGLIGRLPQLLGLSFADGTPLCPPEARAWLDAEVLVDGSGPGPGPAAGGPEPLPEALTAALDAARTAPTSELPEAVAAVQVALSAATSDRQRFRARVELAEIALSPAPRLAFGLLASLADEAAQLGLDRWEPALASRCLSALVRSEAKAGEAKPLSRDPSFERLCRVDPAAALRL